MTVIKRCSCTHDFQDKIYGQGMRVHNTTVATKNGKYRCTVCGKTSN